MRELVDQTYRRFEANDFDRTQSDEIMIRALDFTIDPEMTCRYRIRAAVFNPNLNRQDVAPGVDTKSLELFGPWSEPTDEVTMLADVKTYVMNAEPPTPRKLHGLLFEVVRWIPERGVTVVKRFPAAPGEIIGEYTSAPILSSSTGTMTVKSGRVNFNSHETVLDFMGGDQVRIRSLGPGADGWFSSPSVSLVLRRDGAVVVRSQAMDLHDPDRRNMVDDYARELKEDEKRELRRSDARYLDP
jgi:hypothetical protein